MKKITIIICLLFSAGLFAQKSPGEIKTLKISKVKMQSYNTDSSETWIVETLYDRNGNDTATYMGGQLYKRSVIENNGKGKILKNITYQYDGKEIETAMYSYNTDGSYKISNTDKEFGMTDYSYFDKSGKITKTQSPDGAERIYSYNAKGNLIKVKTKPGGDGVLVDIIYTYNSKGLQVKEESKGEYKWTTTNNYDSKGLKIKSVTISKDEDEEIKTTSTFQYEFWK